MKLSIVIPARSEFPQIVFTIYSIIHCLETEGFTHKDFEIIVVDNASTDDVYPQRGTAGTTSYLEARGIYFNGVLRILRDPIAGNHSARNKGAQIARGEYLFFSDAHMSYRPGFFTEMIRTIDESGGLFHGTIGWLGAYPPVDRGLGYSYTIKLGEEWKGTWNNYKLADDWWYIPSQGHCSVGVRRDQFIKFGGYPKVHRTYGGGEFYMDMKWWMMGSSVAVNPKCIGYHLSSARGYSYNHTDYVENVLGCTYAIGADDWRERTYINAIRHKNKKIMDDVMARNEVEYAKDREFIAKRRKFTFNELLLNKPWDQRNQKRHGKSNGAMLIYHWTWMEMLPSSPIALDAYKHSKYQKDLEKFIEDNFKEVIYMYNKYDDKKLKELKAKIYG
jgi:glycosyltransferase involved in cell wall biosynthesis